MIIMPDIVAILIKELEANGWTTTQSDSKLIFNRGAVTITAYQNYVTAQIGDFAVSEFANRYLTVMERLDFLLQQIRHYADMADDGTLDEMSRWDSAHKAIEKTSWERALKCREALLLIEKAVELLNE